MLRLQGHEGTVHALLPSPDGAMLLSAGRDGTIRLWDPFGGETGRLDAGAAPVLTLALHAEGKLLASGSADGSLRLWDLDQRALLKPLPQQMAAVTGLAWLSGQRLLSTCGERARPERAGELLLWHFEGSAPTGKIHLDPHGLWSLAAARHAPIVAWSGGARHVVVRDMTRQREMIFRQPKSSLAVALSDDGRSLAAALDRTIKVYDVESGHERATLEGHVGQVRALALAAGGRLLASGAQDQSVRFWRIGSEGVTAGPVYQWPIGGVHALAFAPSGLTIAAGGDRGEIWVWDLEE